MATNDWKSYMNQLETNLDLYLVKKAPALPTGAKEAIVKFGPYITLILMLMALPLLLGLFGLGAILMPFSFFGGAHAGFGFILSFVFVAIGFVLEAMALPGMFHRKEQGWRYAYYAALVGAVQQLVSLNIGSFVIGTVLSLYILFQIKSYYK